MFPIFLILKIIVEVYQTCTFHICQLNLHFPFAPMIIIWFKKKGTVEKVAEKVADCPFRIISFFSQLLSVPSYTLSTAGAKLGKQERRGVRCGEVARREHAEALTFFSPVKNLGKLHFDGCRCQRAQARFGCLGRTAQCRMMVKGVAHARDNLR